MSRHDSSSWDRQYLGEPPAWDIGRPQPALAALAEQGRLSGRVLDAGCGTGEHAILAARHGADALGVDVSPLAIALARTKANERGIPARFVVADCLELAALGEVFDVVVDSGLFHVFDDNQRPRYAASLARVVREGGVVYLTCLSDEQSGDWGARRVSRVEIEETFRDGWAIEHLATCVREINRPEVATWSATAWLATIRHLRPPAWGSDRQPADQSASLRRAPGSVPSRHPSPKLASQLRMASGKVADSGHSPLFVALVEGAAQDSEEGGTVAAAFDGVPPSQGFGPALRLLAALHFLVLSGRAPELAPYFPSAGGMAPPADAWPAARRVIAAELDQVRSLLALPIQTNEPGRGAALFGALLLLAARHRLPLRVIELGASAGLNLHADRFHYVVDGRSLGDAESPLTFEEPWRGLPVRDPAAAERMLVVSARAGCDRRPIDVNAEAGRLRLLSYIWPDQLVRLERLRAAIEVARHSRAEVEQSAVVEWAAHSLAHRAERELVVVWQSVVRPYMKPIERERLTAVLDSAGAEASATRPLASVELEATGGAMLGLELTLRSWPGGDRESLARCDVHGPPVAWSEHLS